MKSKKWFFGLVAFSMFIFITAVPLAAGEGKYSVSNIALTPGADASELNFAWTTDDNLSALCAVEIAQKSTGFEKSVVYTGTKSAADDMDGDGYPDYYYCSVTVDGLKNQTEYIYRLGENGEWSSQYEYSTKNTKRYGFAFLADAQLGASKDLDADIAGWKNTIDVINTNFPETAFIMSAGDQIELPGDEEEWSGFFSPPALSSIPVAPTPGSHDELGEGRGGAPSSYAFDYHFNLPNEALAYLIYADVNACPPPGAPGSDTCTPDMQDVRSAAGDYYFTYGNALFMVLNTDSDDYAQHEKNMEYAIANNPDAKWRIVMWHYTIYTAADRSPFVDREQMVDIMENLDVDVVLTGHDHMYCRSKIMFELEPEEVTTNKKGWVMNPEGILYMTASSASGSKYYGLSEDWQDLEYIAGIPDEEFLELVYECSGPPDNRVCGDVLKMNTPTFTYFEINGNTLTLTTYATKNMLPIDDPFTIFKN